MHMKKMIKKIAALGAGVIMTGTTIGSALAVDLTDAYPNEFSSNTAIVIGTGATADSSAQSVINTDLAAVYDTGAVAGTLADEIDDEVPIGQDISDTNVGFDFLLDDADLKFLADSEVNFQGTSYDYREVLVLGRETGIESPSLETSLSSNDDDYQDNIYLEVKRDSIKYFYQFDETINVSKATSSQPLTINFLGEELKIYSVDLTTNKFTAYTGEKHVLNGGESVVVNGYTVTLENVGSNSASVDVDGESQIIGTESSLTFANGAIEVAVSETLSKDLLEDSTAVLYIGEDAQQTYNDGDEYKEVDGTCDNDPSDLDCWVWDIGNLATSSSTTVNNVSSISGPKIGIENDFVLDDATDNPPTVGECISLPNNYASICFDSLVTGDSDDDYVKLTIKRDTGIGLDTIGGISSSSQAVGIRLHVDKEEALRVKTAGWAISNANATDKRTEDIFIVNNASASGVYWEDENGELQYAGVILNDDSKVYDTGDLAIIDFGDTSGTNINISFGANISATVDAFNITLDINGDNTNDLTDGIDDIQIQWGVDGANNFDALGITSASDEAAELRYNGTTITGIGTKDENHRTRYGIIIENPKTHSTSNEVALKIPNDQIEAVIKIGGAGETSTTGPMLLEADEVTDKETQNLILVGGPAINELTADFLGLTFPAYGEASGLVADEAVVALKANGDNWAMLVYGWEAADTSRAANAVKDGLPTAQAGDMEIKV